MLFSCNSWLGFDPPEKSIHELTRIYTKKLKPSPVTVIRAQRPVNNGQQLLVTVDGRQPQIVSDCHFTQLADLLLRLAAVNAISLDGGGSTTMVVEQRVVSSPTDQTGEHPVGDAILVFSTEK